jgi:hypothetical protein
MGKPSAVDPQKPPQREQRARWPFDPMQPGDHEPARLPEELERVQKQTGAGRPAKPKESKR